MPDREKVMSWLEGLAEPDWRECYSDSEVQETARQALDLIDELLKEQETQKFFVDESGKITPLPVVVRCKDCKHRPIKPDDYETGFDLEFPDGECPCKCDDGYYSWYPNDNWFCAGGERKEGK